MIKLYSLPMIEVKQEEDTRHRGLNVALKGFKADRKTIDILLGSG